MHKNILIGFLYFWFRVVEFSLTVCNSVSNMENNNHKQENTFYIYAFSISPRSRLQIDIHNFLNNIELHKQILDRNHQERTGQMTISL